MDETDQLIAAVSVQTTMEGTKVLSSSPKSDFARHMWRVCGCILFLAILFFLINMYMMLSSSSVHSTIILFALVLVAIWCSIMSHLWNPSKDASLTRRPHNWFERVTNNWPIWSAYLIGPVMAYTICSISVIAATIIWMIIGVLILQLFSIFPILETIIINHAS